MQSFQSGERTLTELDFSRLTRLVGSHPQAHLADLLDGADVLQSREIPRDVVTMNSQVELEDLRTQRRQRIALRYPPDAEPASGGVSVLSPVGGALLGLSTGAVAQWTMPSGEQVAAKIVAVHFQPEAAGDYLR